MFNRTIQLDVVKKTKNADDSVAKPEVSKEDLLDIARIVVTGTGLVIVEVVASYMVLDTVRKIAINRLSK